mmetsp:Transcript_20361/g.37041  ORF Transcript_20361/g.37041 Transcript_20361/m.37041 type:complete len:164 (+) Transcript_20361:113-604(+)
MRTSASMLRVAMRTVSSHLLVVDVWTKRHGSLGLFFLRTFSSRCHVSMNGRSKRSDEYLTPKTNLSEESICSLCGLDFNLTIHHLIPLVCWKRLKRKGKLRGSTEPPTAILCRTCHNKVHHAYPNSELARNYSSVDKLLEAGALQKYFQTRRALIKIQGSNGE